MSESPQINSNIKFLNGQIAGKELFQGETFRIASEAFSLPAEQMAFLDILGNVIYSFYKACNLIYRRSWKENKSPWVSQYMDMGKPVSIVSLSRQKKFNGDLPRVLRPDLLLTEEGFSLTELDSVPGGIGLTGFLNQVYQEIEEGILGSNGKMVIHFMRTLQEITGKGAQTQIALCVSDESYMYRPEMDWIASEMVKFNAKVIVVSPSELDYRDDAVFCGDFKIDVIYRFFELFDLPDIPQQLALLEAVEKQFVHITPPIKPVLEEKMWFSLFRHPELQDQWHRELGDKGMKIMDSLIPTTTIMDPSPLPPQALLSGLKINHWDGLKAFSQKERDWIVKISGFSPMAWGAKGVYYGSDLPQDEWKKVIDQALSSFPHNPYIIQKFSATKIYGQNYISGSDQVTLMKGRVRLCPYYFVIDNKPALSGALATICPSDKKLIHGMDVAVLSPLGIRQNLNDYGTAVS